MKENNHLPKALLEHIPWEQETNPIWPASSFILHRNINKYFFPPKMNEAHFQQTATILQNSLLRSSILDQPVFLGADLIDATEKEFLFEHFLCLEGFQNTLGGQGFIVDNSSRFLGMLNIQDHLQIQLIDCKGAWEQTWNTISQIENSISETVEFAFSPKFGYLTSDPYFSGTGLVVLAYLHLPALIHTGQLEDTLIKHREEEITATGMQGTIHETVGDILVLRNSYTTGVSEENILHSLHSMAMKLMAIEKALRSHLTPEKSAELKDMVSRSFGLLMHSYQLQTKEAMNSISLLKMGLDLGWIKGVTDQKLTEALFRCRRAHLLCELEDRQIAAAEIPRKRAEYLHRLMHTIELAI